MAVANLIKFTVPTWGTAIMQKWCALEEGAIELYTHEKAVFFVPVNILTVWSPAFLTTRHTTMCLDFSSVSTIVLSVTQDESCRTTCLL